MDVWMLLVQIRLFLQKRGSAANAERMLIQEPSALTLHHQWYRNGLKTTTSGIRMNDLSAAAQSETREVPA